MCDLPEEPISVEASDPDHKFVVDLSTQAQGRFHLITESGSLYSLDLGAMTLTRWPNSVRTEPDLDPSLRFDESPMRLLRVIRCEAGSPAVFAIDLGIDGVGWTLRTTTTVQSIEAHGGRET